MSLSTSTLKNYQMMLDKLDNLKIGFKNIKNINDAKIVIEMTKNIPNSRSKYPPKTISYSTFQNYLSAIVYYLKNNNNYDNYKELFNEQFTNISKSIKQNVDENKLIGNQVKNYIEWDKIISFFKQLKSSKEYMNNYVDYLDFVLFSVYVLFEPRRAKDYYLMKISEPNDDEFNYYVKENNDYYFIFNNYKTSSKFGTQKFIVPKRLASIINGFVKTYKLKEFMFPDMNQPKVHYRLSKLLNSKFPDKTISVDILRHSYVSFVLKKKKLTTYQKKIISYKMAHSIMRQDEYRKFQPIKK